MTVNEKFEASKLDQLRAADDKRAWLEGEVSSGKMIALGNDRYQITSGWDRGEVISVIIRDNSLEILNSHGLDVTGDRVSLYTRVRPWHGFGQIIPAGLTSVDGVLRAAGLDWEVDKRPVLMETFDPEGNTSGHLEVPDQFVTYRTDNQTPLGVVGKIYKPVQNAEGFGFLEALFEGHDFLPETAGSLRGGRKTFISAKCPEGMIVDPNGVADETELFAMFGNSHDGSTPVYAAITPWRPVCSNTEQFALRDAKYRFTIRHTKNWRDKLAEAKRVLKLTADFTTAWVAEETELIRAEVTMDDVMNLITDVWGELGEEPSKRASTMDRLRREDVAERFEVEAGRVGRNAFAAERAITGNLDHWTTLKPRDEVLQGSGNRLLALGQALLEESLTPKKTKAHAQLLELVRR